MNLSNWNPFKFMRRKSEDKKVEIQRQPAAATPSSATLAPYDAMQQMMQHFLRDPFFSSPTLFGTLLAENRWFGDFSPIVFQPTTDVVDEGKALRITVELPGMSREDVELTVDDGALTIKGEKTHRRQQRRERLLADGASLWVLPACRAPSVERRQRRHRSPVRKPARKSRPTAKSSSFSKMTTCSPS